MATVYRTIHIDIDGNVIDVLDENGKSIEYHTPPDSDDTEVMETYTWTKKRCFYWKGRCYCV